MFYAEELSAGHRTHKRRWRFLPQKQSTWELVATIVRDLWMLKLLPTLGVQETVANISGDAQGTTKLIMNCIESTPTKHMIVFHHRL
jgi:hypothetical protein